MNSQIYDRHLLTLHRDKAANSLSQYDFLFKASAEDIVERAAFYNKEYEDVLDLGCRTGQFYEYAKSGLSFSRLYQADLSRQMLDKVTGIRISCDEELLPFVENSFDLVVSNLNLHWVNRMLEALEQIKVILKPGGLFIAAIIGGSSLKEMRELLIKAELAAGCPVGFRVSPMITAETMMLLAQRAGLSRIVVDSRRFDVEYSSVLQAMADLQKMGESNCMMGKVEYLRKSQMHGLQAMGNFAVNFEIITLSAFKPSL